MPPRKANPLARAVDLASFANNLYVTRSNPVSLVHFVTNRCNARCSFCFIDFENPDLGRDELSLDEIDRLTLNLGSNLKNVNLTGGEPFAHKDILKITQSYFRNTNIESIFMTTNGSLPERLKAYMSALSNEFPDRKQFFSFSIDAIGEKHDQIRKINGLFDACLQSYRLTQSAGENIIGSISITVSPDNWDTALETYEVLIQDYGVKALTCVIVRDEGVFKAPEEVKKNILSTYKEITERISRDLISGRLGGYNNGSLQGRLMNQKNKIMYNVIRDTYLVPEFKSQCYAGSLFGIIHSNGDVYPCEILDKKIGSLREFDFDFMKLWQSQISGDIRDFIRDTKCNCTYECAWSFNILANYQYLPSMISGALTRLKS